MTEARQACRLQWPRSCKGSQALGHIGGVEGAQRLCFRRGASVERKFALGRKGRCRACVRFVIDVDLWPALGRFELDEASLEEAGDAAGQALAAAHDDRVGAQLVLDLGQQLLDGAPAVGANTGRPPKRYSCVDDADGLNIDSGCDLVVGADWQVRLSLGDQPTQVAAHTR